MSGWAPPVRGGYVTSSYGPRKSPGGVGSTNHRGLDFGGRGTDWLVRSIGPGHVLARGVNGVRGVWVAIRHDDGSTTAYQHLADVRAAGRVEAGTVLGVMGMTGTSTATHLHLEAFPAGRFVRVGDAFASTDRAVDPEAFARARGVDLRTGVTTVSNPGTSTGSAPSAPGVTAPTPIAPRDWFDMATQQDLIDAVTRGVAPVLAELGVVQRELDTLKTKAAQKQPTFITFDLADGRKGVALPFAARYLIAPTEADFRRMTQTLHHWIGVAGTWEARTFAEVSGVASNVVQDPTIFGEQVAWEKYAAVADA